MARSVLLRLARSQGNHLYLRNFQSGYHLNELPTWTNTEGSKTYFNSSSQLVDIQKRWYSPTSSTNDESNRSPGYQLGQLPTPPYAEGAYTLPSSASHITGFQQRLFSHTTLSENDGKMVVPETKRPSVGLKAYGNFSITEAVNCHNKALLANSRPYHSATAEKEGENSTVKSLRPLSPHLAIYQPLGNSMASILNRISSITLTLACLGPYLWLNIASIGFTYSNFYLFSFYASNFVVVSAELTALAFIYHLYQSILHLVADFSGKLPITKRMK